MIVTVPLKPGTRFPDWSWAEMETGKATPAITAGGALTANNATASVWKAPMSGVAGRVDPRSSVLMLLLAAPAAMAGLPASRAMVGTGPP